MKRRVELLLGALILCAGAAISLSGGGVAAQDEKSADTKAGAQKPGKIAVINKKTVFDNYKKRETEWKALEADKTALQAEVDKLRDQVNAGRTKLREDKTLTEQQRQELVDQVAADERAYEDKWRRAQGEIDDKSEKFFTVILDQISAGVREVGAAENYKVILDCDPKAGTPVLYFDPSLEITEKVTNHLNSK